MWLRVAAVALVLVVAGLGVRLFVIGTKVPKVDVVALGDSYTVALRSGDPCDPGALCPENSWSTGTNKAVDSHLHRIRARRPATSAANFAVSGRKLAEMDVQADQAVEAEPGYVTLLAGLNDVCRENEAAMTSVGAFRAAARKVLGRIGDGLPDARVFVASIPDPYRFWEVLRTAPAAREHWESGQICAAMLARPLSREAGDVARRKRVRERTADFNAALATECAKNPRCRFDGNAVFDWNFGPGDVSTEDHFHLSRRGERRLAALTWPLASAPS